MHYVVAGGGVAGVSCAYELCRLRPEDRVTLVAASSSVKASLWLAACMCMHEAAAVLLSEHKSYAKGDPSVLAAGPCSMRM